MIAGLSNIGNQANGASFGSNFGSSFGPSAGSPSGQPTSQPTSQPNKNDVVFAVNPKETDSAKPPASLNGKLITVVGSGVNEGP